MTACSHSGSSVPLLPRGVRRVLDAMCELGHDWSLADLADISGVSGRTLQRHCRLFRFGCFEPNSGHQ
jgi:AraC-like DNA-binding protein